ncbi:MAG: hypothetical protein IGS38_16495 [Synechococcales cyanobacterium M58_A2018_015]|nr:hypothetical protein [Synechococcales cyanobacterium M58_A2018_015]
MPDNLKIGAFIFGAILVLIALLGGNFKLIALLGGNFKLFGAEVAATISNRFLRFVAFALGTTFLVVAVHSPNLGNVSVFPISPSPEPTQSPSSSPSPKPPQPSPSPANSSPGSPQDNSSSACVLTISSPLVRLMSEPDRFSRQIATVSPGEYTSLGHKVKNFHGLKEDGWLQIEVEGRKGWIVEDMTIDRKSSSCP